MGCFSFLCKKCGKGILSTSFHGEQVKLYLLKDGNVIEMMEGEYDSYGRVFTSDKKDSIHWKAEIPVDEDDALYMTGYMDNDRAWSRVCELMFDENESNGIAAIHVRCCNGTIPITRSENDPNQGWGDEMELMGDVGLSDLIEENDSCLNK